MTQTPSDEDEEQLLLGYDLGPNRDFLQLTSSLEAIRRVVTFSQDLAFMSDLLVRYGDVEATQGLGRLASAGATDIATASLRRLLAGSMDGEARGLAVADWYLGRAQSERSLLPPPTVTRLEFSNPLVVVCGGLILGAAQLVRILVRYRDARLKEAQEALTQQQVRKARAETVGVELDNLERFARLAEVNLTREVIAEIAPSLPRRAVRALAESPNAKAAEMAVRELPPAVEVRQWPRSQV